MVQEAARVAVAEAEGPLKKQAVRWAKRDDARAGLLEEPTATLRLRWGNGKPALHLGERVIAYNLKAVGLEGEILQGVRAGTQAKWGVLDYRDEVPVGPCLAPLVGMVHEAQCCDKVHGRLHWSAWARTTRHNA